MITITDDDTISSFTDKLQSIGAEAYYDETTGVFSINIGAEQIRDIDSTGIIEALHLTETTSGYSSSELEYEQIEEFVEAADRSTLLSELGVTSGTVTVESNGAIFEITLEDGDTIGDFLDVLTSEGLKAEFEDGIFTLYDAAITSDGGTNLIEAFGLSSEVISNVQSSGDLTYTTVVSEIITAGEDTLLNELESGVEVNDGDTVIIKTDSGVYKTITMNSTDTIGSLISKLTDSGLEASITDTGYFTISGGEIIGGSYDVVTALGLRESETGELIYTESSGSVIYSQTVEYAAGLDTTFGELGIENGSAVISDKYGNTVTTITMSSDNTIADFLACLSEYGISGSIENGILSLDSSGDYFVSGGSIADAFGIFLNYNTTTLVDGSTTTIGSSFSSAGALTYTTTVITSETIYSTATVTATITSGASLSSTVQITYTTSTVTTETIYSTQTITTTTTSGTGSTSTVQITYTTSTVTTQTIYSTATISETVTTGASLSSTVQITYTTSTVTTQTIYVTSTIENTTTTGLSWTSTVQVMYTSTITTATETIFATATTSTTTTIGSSCTSTVQITYTTTTMTTYTQTVVTTTESGNALMSTSAVTYNKTVITTMTVAANSSVTTGSVVKYTTTTTTTATVAAYSSLTSTAVVTNTVLCEGIYSDDIATNNTVEHSGSGNLQSCVMGDLYGWNYNSFDRDTMVFTIINQTTNSTLIVTKDTSVSRVCDMLGLDCSYGDYLRNNNSGYKLYISERDTFLSIFDCSYSNSSGSTGDSVYTATLKVPITLSASTTWFDLGASSNMTIVVTNSASGTKATVTISYTSTVATSNAYFTISVSGGKATISMTDGYRIYSSGSYSSLASYLKISSSSLTATTTSVTTTKTTSTSTKTLDSTTTWGDLYNGTLGLQYTDPSGTTYYITLSPTATVEGTYGNGAVTISISGGKATITCAYRYYMQYGSTNGGIYAYLKIDGNDLTSSNLTTTTTTTTSTKTTTTTSTKTTTTTTTTTITADSSTALGQLGLSGTVYQTVYSNGSTIVITVTTNTTIGSLISALTDAGFSASLDNGIFSISGSENVYYIDFNDTLDACLNLRNQYGESSISGNGAYTTSVTDEQTSVVITMTSSGYITAYSSVIASTSTKLGTLLNGYNNTPDDYSLIVNGKLYSFSADDTISDVISALQADDYTVTFENGVLSVSSGNEITISGPLAEFLFNNEIKYTSGSIVTSYTGSESYVTTLTSITAAGMDTTMAELGITAGEFYIYNNGVRYKVMISSTDTIDDLRNILSSYGISSALIETETGVKFALAGNGDSYIASSASSDASNIVSVLFNDSKTAAYNYSAELNIYYTITTSCTATLDTLLSEFDSSTLKSEGTLAFTIDGNSYSISVSADETFGSLIDKLESIGLTAYLSNGVLCIRALNKDFSVDTDNTTSGIVSLLGLYYNNDLDGYMISSAVCESTTTIINSYKTSAAEFADMSTLLETVNISSGTFSIYRNGERAVIQVDSSDTFAELRSKIAAAFSDVDLTFENGYLKIYSKTDGVTVEVSSTVDTSNIAAICGFYNEENGVISARQLYKVNGSSVITDSGLFKLGDVTEGTFTIGNAVFTITNTTTLDNLISQINSSDDANASAYWDAVDGKLVIQSKTTGASYINIEAGTSNFTDILGLTSVSSNGSGYLVASTQTLGSNAKFSINGTNYTASSNTITSDISRITGVTLNLKSISEDETVTVTVEKDPSELAAAISDIVDAYNELIAQIDSEIASTGNLHDQSMLKIIRNQIRSLMTSSVAGNSVFKNLDAVGIKFQTASGGNLSTADVNTLYFDEDAFLEAFQTDSSALEALLVGTADNEGILMRIEDVVENALQSVTGYFATAESAYEKKISRLDTRISKATAAVEKYRTRLETKFNAMELLISNMQSNYSSFLI